MLSKLDDAKAALKASRTFGVTAKVGMLLAGEPGSVQPGTLIRVLEKVKYAADKAQVSKYYKLLSDGKQAALTGHEADVGEFLGKTGEDGVRLIENMGDNTLQKMFSINSDRLDTILMNKLSVKLAKLYAQGVSPVDIEKFVDNMDKLKEVNGI